MAKKPKEVILDSFSPEADVDTIDNVELLEEPRSFDSQKLLIE